MKAKTTCSFICSLLSSYIFLASETCVIQKIIVGYEHVACILFCCSIILHYININTLSVTELHRAAYNDSIAYAKALKHLHLGISTQALAYLYSLSFSIST